MCQWAEVQGQRPHQDGRRQVTALVLGPAKVAHATPPHPTQTRGKMQGHRSAWSPGTVAAQGVFHPRGLKSS